MIDYIENDGIATVSFSHGKVNAMDLEFCSAVVARLHELANDDSIKAVILSSKRKAFSAGIDLKRWLAEGAEYVRPFMLKLEELFQAVFCFSKPLVTDICGSAIAGGCMVAASGDFRVIRPESRMGILESRLGVPLPMTAIEIMRHVAKPSVFREIVSIGATFDGAGAVENGLADRLSNDSMETATKLAHQLTEIPVHAFRLTKQQRTAPVMRIVEARDCESSRKHKPN